MQYTYDQARDRIQNGDIVFIKNKSGILPWIIRLFTSSSYSHVGIAFWVTVEDTARLMIAETQGGVNRRILNLSYYASSEMDIVKAPVPWPLYFETALHHLGKEKYGWLDACYIGIREFFIKKLNIRLPIRNFYGEICSEYVARLLIRGLPDIQPSVSPQGLFEQICPNNDPYIMIRK